MDRSDLDHARELFVKTAHELEASASLTADQLRSHLRHAAHSVLDLIDDGQDEGEGEDVVSELDRKSRDIAEDLRRVERLMRKSTNQDD